MSTEPLLFERIAELRAHLDAERVRGRTVGLVPTMGALHDGHASLVQRAAADDDVVVVTIFVNPLQFGPTEDFEAYPRPLDADIARAVGAGATVIAAPTVREMYPGWPLPVATSVRVAGVSERMEGASRPGHFDGVATVVAKLFHLGGPCRAYFGEKDWQQLAVVRQMTIDLGFPVEVIGCPTVREADGLALSSRNAYLTAPEREAAPVLHRGLLVGLATVRAGERSPAAVAAAVRAIIEPVVVPDYVEVVDAASLAPVNPLRGDVRLLVAARFGRARLIDNVGITIS